MAERVPICSASRTVVMPSTTGLVTAVLDGHTLTSPTAYYSFDALSAWNYSPAPLSWLPITAPHGPTVSAIGQFLTNVIVPVMSADVSTIPAGTNVPHAMDWSNLNAPIPLLAYIEGDQCAYSTNCSVVYQDDYAPILAIPLQALNLDPAWSTCSPDELGVYDPPHALQATAAAANPTNTFTSVQTAFPITTIPPEPGPTASTILPTSIATSGGGTSKPGHGSGDTSDPRTGGGHASPGVGANANSDSGSSVVKGKGNAGSLNPSADPGAERGSGHDPGPSSDASGPDVDTSSARGSQGSDPRVGGAIGPGQAADESGTSPGNAIASVLGLHKLPESGVILHPGDTPETGGSEGSYNDGDELPGEFDSATSNSRPDSAIGQTSGSDIAAMFGDPMSVNEGSSSSSSDSQAGIDSFGAVEAHAFAYAGTQPIFVDPSRRDAIIVEGHTISPGDPAISIENTRISVAADGHMIMGTSVVTIPAATTHADAQSNDVSGSRARCATFTGINGAPITASEVAAGTIVAAGQTLSVGGPTIEVEGRTMSAASNGLIFIDGSHTSTSAFSEITAPPRLEAILTMADGSVVTAFEEPGRNGVVVVDGHTLSPGNVASIDGEILSDGPDGLVVLDGSNTSKVIFSTANGGDGDDVATSLGSSEGAKASASGSDVRLPATVLSLGASIVRLSGPLLFLWVFTIVIGI